MRAAVRKPAPLHAGDSRSVELVESSGGGRVPVRGRQESWEARWAVCCKGGAPCEAQLVEDAHLVMWRPRGELSAGDRSLNGETGEEQVEAERMGPARQRHWERGADTGASCALGAGNVHLWQMCSQMQLREHAEAVSRASALRWRQFLRWIRWEPNEGSLAWEGRAPEASFQDVAAAVLKALLVAACRDSISGHIPDGAGCLNRESRNQGRGLGRLSSWWGLCLFSLGWSPGSSQGCPSLSALGQSLSAAQT